MEAKNAVRYLPNEYKECADEDGVIQKYKVPIHEPSFKAGRESWLLESKPTEPWDREQTVFEDGKQAGRNEVVEWVERHSHKMNTNMYGISLGRAEWQTQLKIWEKNKKVE